MSAKISFNSFSLFALANLTSFGSPELINFDGGKIQFIFCHFLVTSKPLLVFFFMIFAAINSFIHFNNAFNNEKSQAEGHLFWYLFSRPSNSNKSITIEGKYHLTIAHGYDNQLPDHQTLLFSIVRSTTQTPSTPYTRPWIDVCLHLHAILKDSLGTSPRE